ncbi:hypothetical protein SDC9_90550 [bioreactor metagenome]|uniref:Uncharacterized protein n=1 Tax=bioreactor metagenome TaxID=1076179 RepID=A0A644ZZ35_9ZZZZ
MKQKSREQGDRKRDEQSRDVRADGNKTEWNELLLYDVVIYDEIEQPVESYIGGTAHAITEKLPAEIALERRIKEINKITDKFSRKH